MAEVRTNWAAVVFGKLNLADVVATYILGNLLNNLV